MQPVSWLGPAIAFLSIVVTIVLALVGMLIRQGSRTSERQTFAIDEVRTSVHGQEVTLARVDATVSSVVSRVDDLHRWKNDLQKRELENMTDLVAQLRREKES